MHANPPLGRRDAIAARLSQGRSVVAATLAAEFHVSEDAIRRDLRTLAMEGRCRRVYGGALPLSPATATMAARIEADRPAKQHLARAAVTTVQPGELLFLDSGSTNLHLVDLLPEDADLTVATNSVEIAAAVLRRQDLELIVVGGRADPLIGGCVDAAAVLAVTQMRIDRTFVGACSVSRDGVEVFHFTDASFKRAVLAASLRTLVLATADKLTHRAPHRIAPLSMITTLVVEHGTDAQLCADFAAHGCATILRAQRD